MTNSRTRPTDAELDILRVLWAHGPGTVKEVHEKLPESPHRGYTTVLKLMQIMSDKGLLTREKRGRAHVYRPLLSAEQTQRTLLSHLIDNAFDGSAGRLVRSAAGIVGEAGGIRRRRSTPAVWSTFIPGVSAAAGVFHDTAAIHVCQDHGIAGGAQAVRRRHRGPHAAPAPG